MDKCKLHGKLAEDGKCDVCEGRGLWEGCETPVPPKDIAKAMSEEIRAYSTDPKIAIACAEAETQIKQALKDSGERV